MTSTFSAFKKKIEQTVGQAIDLLAKEFIDTAVEEKVSLAHFEKMLRKIDNPAFREAVKNQLDTVIITRQGIEMNE